MREPSKNSEPLLTQEAPSVVERMGLTWLIAAAIATALLWQVPGGDYIYTHLQFWQPGSMKWVTA